MIYVTRLDGSQLVVNADLIETVEHTADTVITLLDGKKLVVKTLVDDVVERVIGYRQLIARAHSRGIRIYGATLTPFDDAGSPYFSPEHEAQRQAVNAWIRSSGEYDAVIDFDKVTLDPQSGGLKPEFIPESTAGGAGDKLHPNRTGYLAMGQAIDLDLFKPSRASRSAKSKQ